MSCKDCPSGDPEEVLKKSAMFLVQAHQGMQSMYLAFAANARNDDDRKSFTDAAERHKTMAEWSAQVTLPGEAEDGELEESTPVATEDGSSSGQGRSEESSAPSS